MSDIWTFSNRSNSYFQGNDVVLYQNGEEVGRFNRKDRLPAIEVKSYGFCKTNIPSDVAQDIWDQTSEDWWSWDIQDVAKDCGYERAYSAGRSSGWCCPSPADPDAIERYLQCDAAGEVADEYDVDEAEKFFSFCVAAKEAVEYGEQQFKERCEEEERIRSVPLNRAVAREDVANV